MQLPLSLLAKSYGLSDLQLESQITNQFANDSFMLSAQSLPSITAQTHSANKNYYFCKIHRPEKTAEELSLELDCCEYLHKAGCKLIPFAIPTQKSEFFLVLSSDNQQEEEEEEERQPEKSSTSELLVSLHPYIRSTSSYNWLIDRCSPSASRSAGMALATLHKHGKTVPNQDFLHERTTSIYQALPALLSTALSKLNASTQAKEHLHSLLQNKTTLLSTEITAEHTLIHGDYHPGNLIFNQDQVVAIVDFDYCRFGAVEQDLAYACWMFAAGWSMNDKKELAAETAPTSIQSLLDNSNAKSLLAGYLSAGGTFNKAALSKECYLAAFILLSWLIDCSSKLDDFNLKAPIQHLFSILSREELPLEN
ncbi:MAG: aminoglycoside phosphotransferase family protein [Candidatus Obscuribacterales bacterium]|nr:aminoglycoside phosphotransferase family protein [Candidatus Obscuribacterales bacterium]